MPESPQDHFDPLYLSSRTLIALSIGSALLAVVLSVLVLQRLVPSVLASAALIFACASGFLGGNTYRLSDIRSRMGMRAKRDNTTKTLLAELPPLRVVRYRFMVAKRGVMVSVVMLIVSIVAGSLTSDSPASYIAVAVLGLIAATISFLCGMWSRPID